MKYVRYYWEFRNLFAIDGLVGGSFLAKNDEEALVEVEKMHKMLNPLVKVRLYKNTKKQVKELPYDKD
jgi:hypothetical protein